MNIVNFWDQDNNICRIETDCTKIREIFKIITNVSSIHEYILKFLNEISNCREIKFLSIIDNDTFDGCVEKYYHNPGCSTFNIEQNGNLIEITFEDDTHSGSFVHKIKLKK